MIVAACLQLSLVPQAEWASLYDKIKCIMLENHSRKRVSSVVSISSSSTSSTLPDLGSSFVSSVGDFSGAIHDIDLWIPTGNVTWKEKIE